MTEGLGRVALAQGFIGGPVPLDSVLDLCSRSAEAVMANLRFLVSDYSRVCEGRRQEK